MHWLKRISGCFFLTLFVFTACGKQAAETPLFQSEAQVIDQSKKLKDEGKTDKALALLNRGLQQYPVSMELNRSKYEILWAAKRYEECLQMVNDLLARVPEKDQKNVLIGKQKVLNKLVQTALEKGDPQTALQRLEELADAGYRGFHRLKHDKSYEPLRSMPGFKDILKKITDNTGIGQPPGDFTVTLTNGETFRLSEQKGKVVLLDFWSIYCKPCIKEIPNLKAYYQTYKDKGFEIISISLDNKEEEVGRFLAEHPMPWKTVFSGKGWEDDTARLYDISWVPSLWLVDKDGILRYFDVRGEDLKAVIAQLVFE